MMGIQIDTTTYLMKFYIMQRKRTFTLRKRMLIVLIIPVTTALIRKLYI